VAEGRHRPGLARKLPGRRQEAHRSIQVRGLNLVNANNKIKSNDSPSAAFETIWQMLSMRRIRVFSTLQNFKQEYRVYRRDEHGKLIKKDDHLMDAFRYLVMTWDQIAGLPPVQSLTGAWNSGALDSFAGM
jgi:hypothetical protein